MFPDYVKVRKLRRGVAARMLFIVQKSHVEGVAAWCISLVNERKLAEAHTTQLATLIEWKVLMRLYVGSKLMGVIISL